MEKVTSQIKEVDFSELQRIPLPKIEIIFTDDSKLIVSWTPTRYYVEIVGDRTSVACSSGSDEFLELSGDFISHNVERIFTSDTGNGPCIEITFHDDSYIWISDIDGEGFMKRDSIAVGEYDDDTNDLGGWGYLSDELKKDHWFGEDRT